MKGIATFTLSIIASLCLADKWSFVVAGDGRTNSDPSGINGPVMAKLVEAIKAEHPRFLLWTGDLVHGTYGPVTTPIDQQLTTWKQTVAALEGVPILPVRGNHETYGDTDGKIWINQMKPVIDVSPVNYFPGEVGYSYTFVPPSDSKMTVIALDQFIVEHKVNLTELENALRKAKSSGAKNIFVFAHEMAFTCDNHGDSDNMAKFKPERNEFLDLLEKYGVRYFFAGHDHAYDWMVIRNKRWPKGYALNQVVAGTAGAPFYEDKGYYGDHDGYDLVRKEHKDKTYGYVVVQIDDHEGITVTFKTVNP